MLLRYAIGEELRRHRQEQNKTLKFISTAAAVSYGYVSEVERGLKEPSSEILKSMCNALELKMSDLLLEVSQKLALEELFQELELEMTTSQSFEVAASSSGALL